MRVQSAIDQSSVPHRLQAIEQAQLSGARECAQLVRKLDGLNLVIDRLQVGVDAMRLDLPEFSQGQKERVESLQLAVQKLQSGVDALQLDLSESGAALRQVVNSTAEASKHLLVRTDTLIRRSALTLGQDALLHTPAGFLLVPTEDRTLLSAVWESGGRLEPGTVQVMTALLSKGDYVIDIGAHIGLTVLPSARKVGPTGRVLALEPLTRAAGLLRQSIALNFLTDWVELHQCAAGDFEGDAAIHVTSIMGESSLLAVPGSRASEEVSVRTVDSLVPAGQAVRLVKIDAEGFEPQVWRGMRRVVDENPDLVVVVEFGPAHLRRAAIAIEDWLKAFTDLGFTSMEIDEMSGVIRPLRPVPLLAEVGSINLLMLRQPLASLPALEFE